MKTLNRDAAINMSNIERTGHFDANESVFFARQLEFIKAQTFDVKRPNLNALNLIPVSTQIPEGATTHTYRQYDTVGMAKVLANYADDLPRADVTGKEFTNPIRSIANMYGYSVQEMRSALFANVNLNGRKALATTRAHQEKINQLAFSGDAEHGLPGLLTNANIPEVTLAADGTGSSKTFATKTTLNVIRDIASVINKVETQSKGIHKANQVWMPIEQMALIKSTPMSADNSQFTILNALQNYFPNVTFEAVIELDGSGVGPSDRMYALENSIENWQLEIPMMMRQYPVQQRNLEFVVPVESRFAGVIIEYPLAFAFADGI